MFIIPGIGKRRIKHARGLKEAIKGVESEGKTTAAGCLAALTVCKYPRGGYYCNISRFCRTVDEIKAADLTQAKKWLRKWFKKIGDQDTYAF